MNIVLKIYIIETVLSFCVLLSLVYRCEKRGGTAHRQAIITTFLISLLSFVPIISLIVSIIAIKDEVGAWIKNDPTLPENQSKVKEKKKKKEKKSEPVEDRFGIMDL